MTTSLSFSELLGHLLPDATNLCVDTLAVDVAAPALTIHVTSTQASAACPLCHQPTTRVHSHYTRSLADLPWAELPVRLHLQVRKFFCTNVACQRRIFTERLAALALPWARRTTRLREQQRHIGLALGGAAGARLSDALDRPACRNTVLHLVRTTPTDDQPTPRVLGIDDFALRKGNTYGTILVDLERHCPIDLLPDREATTLAQWLAAHPGIEIISRDRAGAYAEGASLGAPDAVQVADRWHLLKNLGDALHKVLGRHVPALQQAAREVPTADAQAAAPVPSAPAAEHAPPVPNAPARRRRPQQPAEEQATGQRAWQLATYQRVQELAAQGWSVGAIARELQLAKRTARKYRDMAQFVDQRTSARPSVVEPYRAYVEQRWAEGCTQIKQLWQELQGLGFTGSYKSVWGFTQHWQPPTSPAAAASPAGGKTQVTRTSRQAMWLLIRPVEELDTDDVRYREALCRLCPEVATAAGLAQAFLDLVRARTSAALEPWLLQAEQSEVRELRRFALGLRQDAAAVRAALDHAWSNGPVEGQVNRLKLLKRMMFGRAKLDLLRQRVLHPV